MLRPAAAACGVHPSPRLSVARLRDLRAHLDAVLGSSDGDSSPIEGVDDARESPTTGPIRRAPAPCSATIWMGGQRQSGWPFWRSRRCDDCRGATKTQALFGEWRFDCRETTIGNPPVRFR